MKEDDNLDGTTMNEEAPLERHISYGIGGAGNVRRPSDVARDAALRIERKGKKAVATAVVGAQEEGDSGGDTGRRRRSSIMRWLGKKENAAVM